MTDANPPPPPDSTGQFVPSRQQTFSRSSSRRLYQMGLWGVNAAVLGLVFIVKQANAIDSLLGSIMLILATWPALQWAKRSREWFPVFEIFMLTGAVFYAIPFLTEHSDKVVFDPAVAQWTAISVIGFQLAAIWAFSSTRGRVSRDPMWTRSMIPDDSSKLSSVGLLLSTIYQLVAQYTTVIPYQFGAPLRAVFFGLGIISIFIQTRAWGSGNLSAGAKLSLIAQIALQSIVLASQLYLINVLSIFGLALIGYVTSSRRVPILAILIVLPILTVLHAGKSNMRQKYWTTEQKIRPELTDLTAFYQEWWQEGIDGESTDQFEDESHTSLLQRASLFQIIAVVVSKVPNEKPYLSGETYYDVPAQLVPRFFWPDKPTALESNVRLSLYFGLVAEYSADAVSIAFGMVAEAYANFGILGTLGLGAILGLGFKRLTVAALSAATFSPLGIFTILLTAWSLQAEMVAATWISSLFQATLVTVVLPMIGTRMLGK